MTQGNTKDLSQAIAPELFQDEPQIIEDDVLDVIAPVSNTPYAIKERKAIIGLIDKYLTKPYAF